jgi:Gene product 88
MILKLVTITAPEGLTRTPPVPYNRSMTTTLRRSTDRKTANMSTRNGKQALIANAFGMASGKAYSCPGATSVCESVCYAGKLERLFPGMRAMMLANYNAVANATYAELVEALSDMIDGFRADCVKRDAEMAFRIHHDGDFLNREYASAWANVIRRNPDIQFWVYTRSFIPGANVIDIIADIPNLAVYLSVDSANRQYVGAILDEYPTVRIALLADTMADGAIAISEFRTKPGARCPENVKRIPLITSEGGACFSCQLCVKGKVDVRFAASKK